jgi:hypothetical protein
MAGKIFYSQQLRLVKAFSAFFPARNIINNVKQYKICLENVY